MNADIELANPRDSTIRGMRVNSLVDTGALHLCVPEHVALQLGLEQLYQREVTTADGAKPVLTVTVYGLNMFGDAVRDLLDPPHSRGLLQGTLGESMGGSAASIEERLLGRLPVTIQLGVMAIVIGLLIALPVGIYSAIRQDTAADYAGRTTGIIGMSVPNFWLAIMVMIYPVVWWGWSPPLEWVPFTEDPLGSLKGLLIPSLILGTGMSAGTMRLTRTTMLEVLRQDYIRTAWSKGLNERVVVMRHAVKNALIPVVTVIGMQLPLLVGGSVIIENIFNLPGVGRLFLTALVDRDYPMVSGVNLFLATVVVGANLIIDLIYPYLDPRVRYS